MSGAAQSPGGMLIGQATGAHLHPTAGELQTVLEEACFGAAVVQAGVVVWMNALVRAWLRESAAGDLWLVNVAESVNSSGGHAPWLLPMPRDVAMDDGPGEHIGEFGDNGLADTIRWLEITPRPSTWLGARAHTLWICDVSEREQLRGGLQDAEAERETILDNALMGLVLVKGANIIASANPAFEEQMLGYAPGELKGKSSRTVFFHASDYRDSVRQTLAALAHHNGFEGEFLLKRKDGSELWVRAAARAVDPRVLTRGVVWGLLDISESRRLAQALDRTLREREAVVQTSVMGIAISGWNDRFSWVNRTFEEDMLGYPPGAMIGQRASVAFASPETYDEHRHDAMQIVGKGGLYERDIDFRRADGSVLACRIVGKLIDSDDSKKGALWFLRDITAARRLEQELDQSRIERETILRSAPIGIVLAVFQRFRWVNDAFASMLGYTKDELVGHSSRHHFVDMDAWQQLGKSAHSVFPSGESYETEMLMRRKSGALLTAKVYGRALNPSDLEQGAVWTFVDISLAKQAEHAMRELLQRERELSELKTRFVAMTSHEFRTPLASINSAVELLQFYSATLSDAERTEVLVDIKGAVRRMTAMTEDVLTMSRIEAGLLDFRPERAEIRKLITAIVGELESIDRGKHHITLQWQGRAQAIVDEKLLRHSVTNLLANAIKYTPAGGVICLAVEHTDRALEIRVRDNGMGIPAEDLPHLFERFHRARNVGNIQGTGLGLAIAKESAKLHGGTIEVSSEVGVGTEFVMLLPNPDFQQAA